LEEVSGAEISDQVRSTRSVGMSLARRFNAGIKQLASLDAQRRLNFAPISGVAMRREHFVALPGLKRPG
jgi:hypothetical protein